MVFRAFFGLISAIWHFLSSTFRLRVHLRDRRNDIPTSQAPSPDHPRLFALVIGINHYATATKLWGAVADADAIVEYLEVNLGIPNDQIRTLRDQQASRVAIIRAFRDVQNDPRIQFGDPILIYFAGLGAKRTSVSSGDTACSWEKSESILPQDYDCFPGQKVDPLPDRTIQLLIGAIAREKGDNITLILDCCHSVQGMKAIDKLQTKRSMEVPSDISSDLDSDILEAELVENAGFHSGFSRSEICCCVVLAACSQDESAHETPAGGLFTRALLRLLKTTNSGRLTWADILKYLDAIPGQNPRCEGPNQNRLLFSGQVLISRSVCYPIRVLGGNQYFIEVDSTQRVPFGAEFAIYLDQEAESNPLGVLAVVDDSHIPRSQVVLSYKPEEYFDIPIPSFVSQTRLGERDDLIIHVPDILTSLFEAAIEQMRGPNCGAYTVSLIGGQKSGLAKLSVTAESDNNHIAFEITDHLLRAHGLTRIPFLVERTPTAIFPVLHAAAHFYRHLDRPHNNNLIQNKIRVKFHQLRSSDTEYDEEGHPCLYPVGPDLCQDNFIIDFAVVPGAMYGIEITNDTSYDLFPGVFFFNNSDFSIDAWYIPPPSQEPVGTIPLLKNGGSLTVGYGSGDSLPYEFSMREDQTVDIGYLKIFLTTKRVDMSKIALTSPFDHPDHIETAKVRVDVWGIVLIPVVQRR